MNLTSNWNINSIGRWTNVLVPAGLTSYKWGIQGPPEPVHFMWAELSPPRRVNRLAWMLWVVAGCYECYGLLFHFRSEPQNRKLASFTTKPFILLHQFFLRIYQNPFRVDWVTFRYSGAGDTAHVPHIKCDICDFIYWNWRKHAVFMGISGTTYIGK